MGKLEQFCRTRADLLYMKNNEWTKEECLKLLNDEAYEIHKQYYNTYIKQKQIIHSIFEDK